MWDDLAWNLLPADMFYSPSATQSEITRKSASWSAGGLSMKTRSPEWPEVQEYFGQKSSFGIPDLHRHLNLHLPSGRAAGRGRFRSKGRSPQTRLNFVPFWSKLSSLWIKSRHPSQRRQPRESGHSLGKKGKAYAASKAWGYFRATASSRKAAPLGLRVPFSHEMAVTFGTLRSVANCACVNPNPVRIERICLAGIGFTGGGSFTVRSTAGSLPSANPSTRFKNVLASNAISLFCVFICCIWL